MQPKSSSETDFACRLRLESKGEADFRTRLRWVPPNQFRRTPQVVVENNAFQKRGEVHEDNRSFIRSAGVPGH
jgi:hypothetical protein